MADIKPHSTTQELRDALVEFYVDYTSTPGSITSNMQRHVERTHVAKNSDKSSNEGYISFGSLLDISTISDSTWAGSTDFGVKIPWVASLLNRKELVPKISGKPCSLDDLSNNNNECVIGATVDKYTIVRGNVEEVQQEEMALAAEFGILDKGRGEILFSNVMDLNFPDEQKFDTIVANGVLAAVDTYLDPKSKQMEDMDMVLELVMI